VELQSYIELKELVHLAIKVKGQLKRKGSIWSLFGVFFGLEVEL